MTTQEILQTTNHRPWRLPSGPWKYYQEWNDAIFLHWEVDLSELQKWVPDNLDILFFEGKPWVSLVAFTMENVRPKPLPPFSFISNFHEINIRTYVKKGNKTGVYFLSIEGGKYVSCKMASLLSQLPYRHSLIRRQGEEYTSENKLQKDKILIKYERGPEISEKSVLDRWLTERYALFQDTKTHINEFDVHHIEWPLYELKLKELEIDYPGFKELLNNTPNEMHYSPGVQVLAWNKKRIEKIMERKK